MPSPRSIRSAFAAAAGSFLTALLGATFASAAGDDGADSGLPYLTVTRPVTGLDFSQIRSAGFDVLVQVPSGEPVPTVEVRAHPVGDLITYVGVTTDCGRARVPPRRPRTDAAVRPGVVTRLTLTMPEAGA